MFRVERHQQIIALCVLSTVQWRRGEDGGADSIGAPQTTSICSGCGACCACTNCAKKALATNDRNKTKKKKRSDIHVVATLDTICYERIPWTFGNTLLLLLLLLPFISKCWCIPSHTLVREGDGKYSAITFSPFSVVRYKFIVVHSSI